MEQPTDTESLRSQVANLQAELDSLRARYDTLLEAKTRAAERYKADYKKWRDFKRWLFRHAETDDHVKIDESSAYTSPTSVLGKRKQSGEFGPNLERAGRDDHETKVFKQESIRRTKVDLPHTSPVAVASTHQRRKSYPGESPHRVLSPSPGNNRDPFLVSQSSNHDDKSSVLDNNIGKSASSRRTGCVLRAVCRDAM